MNGKRNKRRRKTPRERRTNERKRAKKNVMEGMTEKKRR